MALVLRDECVALSLRPSSVAGEHAGAGSCLQATRVDGRADERPGPQPGIERYRRRADRDGVVASAPREELPPIQAGRGGGRNQYVDVANRVGELCHVLRTCSIGDDDVGVKTGGNVMQRVFTTPGED